MFLVTVHLLDVIAGGIEQRIVVLIAFAWLRPIRNSNIGGVARSRSILRRIGARLFLRPLSITAATFLLLGFERGNVLGMTTMDAWQLTA